MSTEPLVVELKNQYDSTLAMYQSLLERCPDEVWYKEFADVPF